MDEYTHLRMERASLQNDRRTRIRKIPRSPRGDLKKHGEKLRDDLDRSLKIASQQHAPDAGKYVFKIHYSGMLDISHLHKHGIDFVSQESSELCVVFADESGLSVFKDHLQAMGLENTELTYKQILEAIEGIDNWTAEDRKSWSFNKIGIPESARFVVDVELWPILVADHPDRLTTCQQFEKWLAGIGITKLDRINLDSLVIYRLDVDESAVDALLNHCDVRQLDMPPATGISYKQLNRDIEQIPLNIPSPSTTAARVCVLDSGVATNHPLLAPAIAESADFIGGDDGFDLNGHGTAVASVVLYGDLEACNVTNFWKPELLILNGRVLDHHAEFDIFAIENTIIKAVKYFADEYKCRIFNLSLGNINAPYNGRHVRGLAYVLDKLSRDLGVLFIVSSGNFTGSVEPEVPRYSWRDEYPEYLLSDESRIVDPAPSLNSLTVGSLARHNATFDAQRYPEIAQISPASENQPSPFTRHGPSVKGSIKPELVATGGNLASSMRTGNEHDYSMQGMGVLACNSKFVGNTLFGEVSGTSFAAPYITHLAGRLYNYYPEASANLLRAMLVNHANMPYEVKDSFPADMQKNYKAAYARDAWRDVAGYGAVDESELFRSTENVVVLMSEDTIENNAHHFFELPLPSEFLRTQRAAREIRVTLSYFPAVRTTRLDYTATNMNFCLVKDVSLEAVQQHFNHDTQKLTSTRNDDATGNRDIGSELRSKGTVQSSTWRMKQRNPNEKWFVVVTRQDRDWGEAISSEKEEYALVTTVADRENENAKLYENISLTIKQRVSERTRVK